VFLKVTPTVGIGRAMKSRKLTLRFVKPLSPLWDCLVAASGKPAQHISCFTIEEICSRTLTCAGIRWHPDQGGSDYEYKTGKDIRLSSKEATRKRDTDGESPLGGDY